MAAALAFASPPRGGLEEVLVVPSVPIVPLLEPSTPKLFRTEDEELLLLLVVGEVAVEGVGLTLLLASANWGLLWLVWGTLRPVNPDATLLSTLPMASNCDKLEEE